MEQAAALYETIIGYGDVERLIHDRIAEDIHLEFKTKKVAEDLSLMSQMPGSSLAPSLDSPIPMEACCCGKSRRTKKTGLKN